VERQATFEDVVKVQTLGSLTPNEKRVVTLLDVQCTQGLIAERLHLSRSFVSQTVKKLESNNLIKKITPGKYNTLYELSSELKSKYKDKSLKRFSHADTHYVKRKYHILHISHPVSKDKRAGYQKSWPMSGWTMHKFWYDGKAGEPRVTIDVTPKNLIAYTDARQKILAESVDEAKDKITMAIHNAVQKFVREQSKFGVHIQIDELGEQITPTHYAFPMSKDSPYANAGSTQPESWQDASPQNHGEPDRVEFETTDKAKATALDLAIDRVLGVDEIIKDGIRLALPESMKQFEKSVAPTLESIIRVEAMLQGGITISQQYHQMVNFMTSVMEEMAALRKETAELKESVLPQRSKPLRGDSSFSSGYTPAYED
jgi:predicted transcriptional regulator